MKTTVPFAVAATAALALASPATAQEAGDIQIKAFVTGVLPDGEITEVVQDDFGLPEGSQTNVSDSYIPKVAIEYFVSSNFSLETICCISPHEVQGRGALDGAELIDAIVLPASLMAKYHINTGSGFKPYVGVGATYFFIFDESVGNEAAALGIDDVGLSSEFGFALQAGFDVPLNDRGLGFSVDAKRYFIDTDATFSAGGTTLIRTEHELDPWVLSAGLAYRF